MAVGPDKTDDDDLALFALETAAGVSAMVGGVVRVQRITKARRKRDETAGCLQLEGVGDVGVSQLPCFSFQQTSHFPLKLFNFNMTPRFILKDFVLS